MEIKKTEISGAFELIPKVFPDSRGYFFESWNNSSLTKLLDREYNWVQDNESFSKKNVIRGFHFQKKPFRQTKLVRCIKGTILDIIIDVEPESPSFKKRISRILSDENKVQLFVPNTCVHGFLVLSDEAIVAYKCDEYYHPEVQTGIRWDDPDLNIPWKNYLDEIPILSDKDAALPFMKDIL